MPEIINVFRMGHVYSRKTMVYFACLLPKFFGDRDDLFRNVVRFLTCALDLAKDLRGFFHDPLHGKGLGNTSTPEFLLLFSLF